MSPLFAKLVPLSLASVFLLSACGENTQEAPKSAPVLLEAPKSAPVLFPVTPSIAQKYDGKIVHQPGANRGKDDGWYLVKNGKRNWIADGAWLEKNGYQASAVIEISSEEFHAIPEDPQPLN